MIFSLFSFFLWEWQWQFPSCLHVGKKSRSLLCAYFYFSCSTSSGKDTLRFSAKHVDLHIFLSIAQYILSHMWGCVYSGIFLFDLYIASFIATWYFWFLILFWWNVRFLTCCSPQHWSHTLFLISFNLYLSFLKYFFHKKHITKFLNLVWKILHLIDFIYVIALAAILEFIYAIIFFIFLFTSFLYFYFQVKFL